MSSTPLSDRELDREWIAENIVGLSDFALKQFQKRGRGFLMMDHQTGRQVDKTAYIPVALLEGDLRFVELIGDETRRKLREYDPASQIVVVIIRSPIVSAYLFAIKKAN